MHVGNGCYIADDWILENVLTGLYDINGKEIKTSNKVNLWGCTSDNAIVGLCDSGFVLFFGSKNGSVMWHLNEKMIKEHHITVESKGDELDEY